ncbi:hypothetical protein N866_19370 [Actinotalea ferrariae CF5-4]|uniref:HPt domain-containing protein n=1 Tax=Actinotalea ferrariae CF5-4 TaxID=948458 RepID=A0A021VR37_9CELL|nr:Hpt domain-containing protein [Actinotalea ferrariae]EYR63606.1 hypothetical protein N866_19370 [Actinotalea ferrariae CF5-4]
MPGDPTALVEQLWAQFLPLVHERVRLIEEVAAGGGDVATAGRAAHNLAGSLGSYGRATASSVARELDLAFTAGVPDQAWLTDAVRRLREGLEVGRA